MQNVRGRNIKGQWAWINIFKWTAHLFSGAGCETINAEHVTTRENVNNKKLENINNWENKAKLQNATITATLVEGKVQRYTWALARLSVVYTLPFLFDFLSFVFVTFWLFGVFHVVFTNHDPLPIFLCAKCCKLLVFGRVFVDKETKYLTICSMSIHHAQWL